MVSYLAVLFVMFIIFMFLSNVLIHRYIQREARDGLKQQSEYLKKVVNESFFNRRKDLKNNPELAPNFRILSRIINADFIIYNKDNRIILKSSKDIDQQIIYLMSQEDKSEYITYKETVTSSNGDIMGYILLFTKLKNVQAFQQSIVGTIMISMIVAILVALLFSYFIQRSITNPIKKLKKDMSSISLDEDYTFNPITTGDEIEDLYHGFKNMVNRLKLNVDERRRFFQNASHELKTPLMSIQGYAEAIRDGVVDGYEVDDSLDIIIHQSKRLKMTVDDILYLTKLENTPENYNFETANIVVTIKKIVKEFNKIAQDKQINIELIHSSEKIISQIDVEKFRGVITNIISNALRYAEHKITIAMSSDEGMYAIHITDDGVGFSFNEENKVFERFYKGKNGNSGIGLTIAKTIVQEHGGTIRAYQNQPKGAGFEIKLPVKLS